MVKSMLRWLLIELLVGCLWMGAQPSWPQGRDDGSTRPEAAASSPTSLTLLEDRFSTRPEGLVTNEYAYRHPEAADARQDRIWELTSGSLFVRDGDGYTGVPDHVSPNAESSNGTNSAVFRCRTRRADFGDVSVDLNLLNVGLYDHTGVGPSSYDGVHIWLRYQSEYELYAVTVNRRDNQVEIKKKAPGGPSNGGTYTTLASAPYQAPYGVWQHVRAAVRNEPNGGVKIALWVNGHLRVSATDTGAGGTPAITDPGRVGVRGDNCEFFFDRFRVVSP